MCWKNQGVKGEVITNNKLLQLATQHCCVSSWKALLHVLPPTSNIVTQQNFVVASWSSMLQQVELASTFLNKSFQLTTTKFCGVIMFGVSGNACNNASQQCCVASGRKILPVLLGLYCSFLYPPFLYVLCSLTVFRKPNPEMINQKEQSKTIMRDLTYYRGDLFLPDSNFLHMVVKSLFCFFHSEFL